MSTFPRKKKPALKYSRMINKVYEGTKKAYIYQAAKRS